LPHTLTVHHGRARPSRLTLPVVDGPADPALPRPEFQPAVPLSPRAQVSGELSAWRVSEDVVSDTTTVYVRDSHRVQPIGEPFAVDEEQIAEATASDARPDRVSVKGTQRITMLQPESRTELVGRIALRSTATHLHADLELRVSVDGEPFFQKSWVESTERHYL
jgi:hypothetical protein